MGVFVNRDDFKGRFNIVTTQEIATHVDNLIVEGENWYIPFMFGAELGEEILNYNSSTSPAKLQNIVDGTTYVYGDITYRYTGLKEVLIPFIYYHVRINLIDDSTVEGFITNKYANSIFVGRNEVISRLYDAYNEGIMRFNTSVRHYINAEYNEWLYELKTKDLIKY